MYCANCVFSISVAVCFFLASSLSKNWPNIILDNYALYIEKIKAKKKQKKPQ